MFYVQSCSLCNLLHNNLTCCTRIQWNRDVKLNENWTQLALLGAFIKQDIAWKNTHLAQVFTFLVLFIMFIRVEYMLNTFYIAQNKLQII